MARQVLRKFARSTRTRNLSVVDEMRAGNILRLVEVNQLADPLTPMFAKLYAAPCHTELGFIHEL